MVDEKYTRPQGLYNHKDVDHKKLRKLILEAKLAPCYPGDDDSTYDLEECPICFLVWFLIYTCNLCSFALILFQYLSLCFIFLSLLFYLSVFP